MFDFNDVIENNNSNNIIDNIQQSLLDIRVVFFNCYKLLINIEAIDHNCYIITNLVSRYERTENNRKDIIMHEIFETLLDIEFEYSGMIKNKNNEWIDAYTSKYFIVTVKKGINSVCPSEIIIKFNDNINIQDLVKLSDISAYNNALIDIKRPGSTDIMSYVRFMYIMNYAHDYTIGDNVLDDRFNKYCIKILNTWQETYNNYIFYMNKTNTKFYFIIPYEMIAGEREPAPSIITSILDFSSAFMLINNNLVKHNTVGEKFVIYNREKFPFYLDTKYDKRRINITITDNIDNTTIPDYILRKCVRLDDIKKTKNHTNTYRIIIVEPC